MSSTAAKRLLVVLVIAFLIVQVGQWRVMAGARSQEKFALDTCNQALNEVNAAVQALAKGKTNHPKYLAEVTADECGQLINQAFGKLKLAHSAKRPAEIRKLSSESRNLSHRATISAGGILSKVAELDIALANYDAAIVALDRGITQALQTVTGLEGEGFFSRHFVEPKRLLSVATGELAKARSCKSDYLLCYRTASGGSRLVQNASSLALAVKQLRDTNNADANQLIVSLNGVGNSYASALTASENLERYPRYRHKSAVISAYGQLPGARVLAEQCLSLNQMSVQNFTLAAQRLAQGRSSYDGAVNEFRQAERSWSDVSQALASLGNARSNAEDEIHSAQSRISSNSQNSQGRAKGLLNEARDKIGEGDRLRPIDPPAAVNAFNQARDLASDAYNAVDTSTDDDSSWSSPTPGTTSGGGGGGGMPGGGSGWGGGGGSPGGGGGSPGGGGMGGPGGGGYGGPTSGSFGDGM